MSAYKYVREFWSMYKNIEKKHKVGAEGSGGLSGGQVVSKTLVQNDLVSMTVFPLIREKKSRCTQQAAMRW